MLNPPKYLTNGRFGPSEQFPIEVEPITEEELSELEERVKWLSPDNMKGQLWSRLLKGYMEQKEKLAEKERVIESMREALEFYAAKCHCTDIWQGRVENGEVARQCLKEVKNGN